MQEEVFPELHIADSSFLNDITERSQCSKCSKSRKYYCYTCCLPIPGTLHGTPSVKLPLAIDVIKHPNEVDGKSSAIQAATLAPEHITIYTYPTIPHYDNDKVILVFPGDKAMTLERFAEKYCRTDTLSQQQQKRKMDSRDEQKAKKACVHAERVVDSVIAGGCKEIDISKDRDNTSPQVQAEISDESEARKEEVGDTDSSKETDKEVAKDVEIYADNAADKEVQIKKYLNDKIERVVFIDSTWHQVHKIASDDRLKGLQRVELETRKTHFWRHQQGKPDTYLATVEAMYYFCRDFHELFCPQPYVDQYDNILFYFKFMYNTIRSLYDGKNVIKAYAKREEKAGKQAGKKQDKK